MKKVSLVFCLILAGAMAVSSYASKLPKTDLALWIENGDEAATFDNGRIIRALENELGRRGFPGNFRQVESESYHTADGESLVTVKVISSGWRTKKACTVPYLLNCYKRVFCIRAILKIPDGSDGSAVRAISANCSSRIESQFLQNDRYDPDLLLDQTERFNLEEKVCAKLARQILGCISGKLD